VIRAEVLDALLAAGATAEQIVAAVKADALADEARKASKRANNAERQRRFKERRKVTAANADNALPGVTPSPNDIYSNPHPDLSPEDADASSTPSAFDPTANPAGKPSRRRPTYPAPAGVPDERWSDFCRQRRKPLTERGHSLLCAKLARLAEAGWPPGDMIDLAIERGWETVFEPREHRNGTRPYQNGRPSGWSPKPGMAGAEPISLDD
jgi:hypothetical protein